MPFHSSATRSKLDGVQVGRAIASMLVILAHLQVKEQQYGDQHVRIWRDFNLGGIGVDVFFVISGFIICYVAGDLPATWRSARRFLLLRVVRVLPLYWMLTTVALAVFLSNPELVNKNSSAPTALVESYLLLPTDSKYLIQNGWTLSYEFLFYFTFSLLLPLGVGWRAITLVLLAGGAAGAGLLFDPAGVAGRFFGSSLLLEFAYGVVLGALFRDPRWRPYFSVPLGVVALAGTTAWMVSMYLWPHLVGDWRGIVWGLPSAIFVFALLCLESYCSRMRLLLRVGDASYSLYLIHALTLPVIGMAWRALHLHGAAANAGMLALMFAGSLLAAWYAYLYVEEPATRHLRNCFSWVRAERRTKAVPAPSLQAVNPAD